MSVEQFVKSNPKSSIIKIPEQGMAKKDFINDFKQYYVHLLGRDENCRSPYYAGEALSLTIRDRLMERWNATHQTYQTSGCRRAYYLSMEYLLGRALSNAMLNLGVNDIVSEAMYDLGIEIEELISAEMDAGLGNGGLGRLAACFMDSCATLQLPVIGYGLRYEYGMFTQTLVNGEQVEKPDHWLRHGNVWEIERLEYSHRIKFGGQTSIQTDDNGKQRVCWIETSDVLAVPFDTPVPGYRNNTVNTLRLWKAVATEEFNLDEFNSGDYAEAVAEKINAENITMVLYPNDANENGKELRLRQQYFLASASLQDVLARWVALHGEDFSQFTEKNCFQLNDTHPSIAIPELMRLLMDNHGLNWQEAWTITRHTMAYTNHTLLPESLEKWPVCLIQWLLPRLMQIIFEINVHFLSEVSAHWPGDNERLRRISIIEEGEQQQVRMAYLAIVGSFSVNGVAKLHSELLKRNLFHDFYALRPEKFNNKTNGVTPRRWLAACNPKLSALITETIGDSWITDLSQLKKLEPYAEDSEFRRRWQAIKQAAKQRLIDFKIQYYAIDLNAEALFDVQVKRIHEYKRQLLNVLHVIHLYNRIKKGDTQNWVPRCVLIGGKAAPSYRMAKKIIKLNNNVATVINSDPAVSGKLNLLFLPDYSVSAMEKICPGADLSEQIST
ncbi:MAG: glycogen/starch/alpha-glucan family phosphorylase, partial [Gammaproteobacteria bacterium]